jgi:hypothetical protein
VVVTTTVITVSEASRSFKCKQAGSGSNVGFAIEHQISFHSFSSGMRKAYQALLPMASNAPTRLFSEQERLFFINFAAEPILWVGFILCTREKTGKRW